MEFSISGWVALREHLSVGAKMTFHLPFHARADFFDEGEVISVRAAAEQAGQVATARLTGRSPLRYPVYAEPSTGAIVFRGADGTHADPVELTRALLRDSALAKSGVRVYFKHIVPLFSRITLTPTKDYAQLRGFLLEEIRGKIEANVDAFTRWGEAVAGDTFTAGDLLTALDLEAIRAAVEPEINNELFDSVFDRTHTAQYLDAIRLLERRLCLNYNTLVLLYSAALRG